MKKKYTTPSVHTIYIEEAEVISLGTMSTPLDKEDEGMAGQDYGWNDEE